MPRRQGFTCIKVEGTLLTQELIDNIVQRSASVEGLGAEDYWLNAGERIQEQISHDWEQALKQWTVFRRVVEPIPKENSATSETRTRWLLPLFQMLQYGRLQTVSSLQADNGDTYAISHAYQQAPIHLLGWNTTLNQRIEGRMGAAKMSAHSLVQDYLNNSSSATWGIVTNGRLLRLLRDNANVARQSFIEFDLETMMDTGAYQDFSALWLVMHASRITLPNDGELCWLETWSRNAQERGIRMRDNLAVGVQDAIKCLGSGFLAHPANAALLATLRDGALSADEFRQQLFRLVYRLIFLFVAEDRDLLLLPDEAHSEARAVYTVHYSSRAIRQRARQRHISRHMDLWERFKMVLALLNHGNAALALPALGSFLWSDSAMPDLMSCKLENTALLAALHDLCWTRAQDESLLPVDWRNLGTEELGSIYESLLELVPDINTSTKVFDLVPAAGNERKTTGSYYTRSDLIQCLLETALDPVMDRILTGKSGISVSKALLSLKVCDPACGSGHFLIAAAHRMAKRLAEIQTGDVEPSPPAIRHALREVISHCIYAVDINPMAVELCKVALWMDSMEPGKPLGFLDHHIKCGNSLVGATPALLVKGVPDDAFKQLEGDNKEDCDRLRNRNKQERKAMGQQNFFSLMDNWVSSDQWADLHRMSIQLERGSDDTQADIDNLSSRWISVDSGKEMEALRLQADAWCAAFVQRKDHSHPITQAMLEQIMSNPEKTPAVLKDTIGVLARRYQFFHWHLEFPDVFSLPESSSLPENELYGWNGGFDVVLGNPPWDRVKMEEEPWFSKLNPTIAKARNASVRKKMIQALAVSQLTVDKLLIQEFAEDKRVLRGTSHFLHVSGRYPLAGVGDVNTYAVFTELIRNVVEGKGRAGFIIPSGIATDEGTSEFFNNLASMGQIHSLYGFENRKKLFPIDSRERFALVTITGNRISTQEADYAFFLETTDDLGESEKHFSMSADEMRLFNPNTGNCPTFRKRRDKEIALAIYHRVPVLHKKALPGQQDENLWSIKYTRLFDMSTDSHLFHTREQLHADGWEPISNRWRKGDQWMVPLYEGKMIHQFDARFGTYQGATQAQINSNQLPQLTVEQHLDPWMLPFSDDYVAIDKMEMHYHKKLQSNCPAFISFRDIARATDQRTGIFAISPRSAYGNKAPLLAILNDEYAKQMDLLCAILNSYAFDWIARMSVGGTNMNLYILEQLPAPSPQQFANSPLANLVSAASLELSYTSWDLYPWARSNGHDHPPYKWDPVRRRELRTVLDAACFHLYGVSRDNVSYIMDSFTSVRSDEEKEFGEFRSNRRILELYEDMAAALRAGSEYRMPLDPPPASPVVMHPWPTRREAEEKMPWIDWSGLT